MLTNINDVSWGTRSGAPAGPKKKKLTLRQKIESYYKGKPWPGFGTIFKFIWNGAPKNDENEETVKNTEISEVKESEVYSSDS